MSIKHIFLSSATAPVPARWREAFPDGLVLGAAAVQAHLRMPPQAPCLVWLSNADTQWPAYLRQILELRAEVPVLLLSGAPEPMEGLAAFNQGARGYTHAYAIPALLQEVGLVVEHGGLWVGPELLQRLVGSSAAALARLPVASAAASSPATDAGNAWALLSAREVQVARAVSAGHSNKEVANLMFISERTVKAHLGAVFEKLGVRDRLQLVLRLAASPDPGVSTVTGPLA